MNTNLERIAVVHMPSGRRIVVKGHSASSQEFREVVANIERSIRWERPLQDPRAFINDYRIEDMAPEIDSLCHIADWFAREHGMAEKARFGFIGLRYSK